MTKDEILSMAKEAGMFAHKEVQPELERFSALVAEKATEQANARQNASWALMCKKMVAAEREACAKVCESEAEVFKSCAYGANDGRYDWKEDGARECAAAIRARGQK